MVGLKGGYVLRVLNFANGAPCPIAGQYVKSFNHHTGDGNGSGEFVADPREAKIFHSAREALDFYQQQSLTHPKRPDGLPNRPLTASTVTIVSLKNAIAEDVPPAKQ